MSDWEPRYREPTSWALGLSCSLQPLAKNCGADSVILGIADPWLVEEFGVRVLQPNGDRATPRAAVIVRGALPLRTDAFHF